MAALEQYLTHWNHPPTHTSPHLQHTFFSPPHKMLLSLQDSAPPSAFLPTLSPGPWIQLSKSRHAGAAEALSVQSTSSYATVPPALRTTHLRPVLPGPRSHPRLLMLRRCARKAPTTYLPHLCQGALTESQFFPPPPPLVFGSQLAVLRALCLGDTPWRGWVNHLGCEELKLGHVQNKCPTHSTISRVTIFPNLQTLSKTSHSIPVWSGLRRGFSSERRSMKYVPSAHVSPV